MAQQDNQQLSKQIANQISTQNHQPAITHAPWYYRTLMQILQPLYYLRLKFQSGEKKANPTELDQRFGKVYPTINTARPVIWCHAVSLGETNTIAPVLEELLNRGYALWVTNTTHTGYARTAELFANQIATGQVYQSYVPVDNAGVINKFVRHVQPCAALFVETELWANILQTLAQHHITSVLVNGRLSQKSFDGYQKIAQFSKSMMDNISLIIAQDVESAKRFRQLGATSDKIRVANSLKWSSHINPLQIAKAQQIASDYQLTNRTVIVGASTHAGEESLILASFATLLKIFPDKNLLLILVPRHPERFDEVATLIEQQAFSFVRRFTNETITLETQVFLADTMGELGAWYQLSNIAIVGGSLVDIGGHNPIEPASIGKPVIMGQYTQSCQQVVHALQKVGALVQVSDEPNLTDSLTQALQAWIAEPQRATQAGDNGRVLSASYQNATQQQVDMILSVMPQ